MQKLLVSALVILFFACPANMDEGWLYVTIQASVANIANIAPEFVLDSKAVVPVKYSESTEGSTVLHRYRYCLNEHSSQSVGLRLRLFDTIAIVIDTFSPYVGISFQHSWFCVFAGVPPAPSSKKIPLCSYALERCGETLFVDEMEILHNK